MRAVSILVRILIGVACAMTLSTALATHASPRFTGPLALAAFALGGLGWLACGTAFVLHARRAAPASRAAVAARWTFLILFFPLPGWLLGWGGGSPASFWAAFALQFAAVFVARGVID